MDSTLTITIAAAFLGLLLFVGLWEFAARRAHNRRWLEEVDEARRIGTHQPLSQHPHIDPHRCIACGSCVRVCPEDALALIQGTARLVHASRCVGHAYCEQVCPVGAITVGLGNLETRPDVPVLSDELESSIPGVFIVGELGGMALIRHGINQGVRAVDEIARRLQNNRPRPEASEMVDVLVVGSGPAGIAATLRARQLGLSFITIDRNGLGGAVRKYPHNKVTMTQPVDVPLHGRLRRTKYRKEHLLELWEELFSRFGIEARHGEEWTDVQKLSNGTLESTTSKEAIVSRFVILALGRRSTPRRLNVPGEDLPHVHYYLDDPAAYADQPLLVVGGGDSAVEAAIALAHLPGNRVTLSYRRPEFFRARRKNIEALDRVRRKRHVDVIFNSHVKRIERDHVVLTVQQDQEPTEKQVPAVAVFILIGGLAPYKPLREIGIRFAGSSEPEKPSEPPA